MNIKPIDIVPVPAELPANVHRWLTKWHVTFSEVCSLYLMLYRPVPESGYRTYTMIQVVEQIANGDYLPKVTCPQLWALAGRGLLFNQPVRKAVVRHLRALGLIPLPDGTYIKLPFGPTTV